MRKFFLAAVMVLMAGGVQAATLNVVNGQLMGASGVLVDGSLYDVQFLDGTCINLYNGCDESSDFTFQTEASAILASQALLDQVFLDVPQGAFDSASGITRGCSATYGCMALTPYVFTAPSTALSAFAVNEPVPGGLFGYDSTSASWPGPQNLGTSHNTSIEIDLVYSVWSPVPEPNTALLLSLGLAGLAAQGRRRSPS